MADRSARAAIDALFADVRASVLRDGGADGLDAFDRLTAAYEGAIGKEHARVRELSRVVGEAREYVRLTRQHQVPQPAEWARLARALEVLDG